MATVVKMPRLSDTMEEGTVSSWLKNVGDKVQEGDILAEIETDKATMEFESFHEGTLLHIGVQTGETAAVDVLLAIIGDEDEDISSLISTQDSSSNQITEEAIEDNLQNKTIEIEQGVEIINMPRLSDTMEEGTVSSWIKSVGDEVEEGDILAEIETDKATMEFESFYSGKLLHIGVEVGQTAAVDTLLAIIGPEGTDVNQILSKNQENPVKKNENYNENDKPKVDSDNSKNLQINKIDNRIFASPLAKKIAKEKGINLINIKGSGEAGRIVKRDVESFSLMNQTSVGSNLSNEFTAVGKENLSEIQNSQIRKTIAKRLSNSKFSAPHYYLTMEINMNNAVEFRNQYNSNPTVKISFNDIILKAVSISLKNHPYLNSQWFDDKIIFNEHIHLGVAVAIEDGLLVPVIKFSDKLNIQQIGAQVKDLASRA
ncbi:MAG: biotin/lipoyl-containing protein, partial [Bacteroidota bacterium]|nr:biotin/lipoyl-containing protein [Bacteroidota bacterium]